jgi:hypothetical protein
MTPLVFLRTPQYRIMFVARTMDDDHGHVYVFLRLHCLAALDIDIFKSLSIALY